MGEGNLFTCALLAPINNSVCVRYPLSLAPVRGEDSDVWHTLQCTALHLAADKCSSLTPAFLMICMHGSKSVHLVHSLSFHISADISGNKMALKASKPKLMAIRCHVIQWRHTDYYMWLGLFFHASSILYRIRSVVPHMDASHMGLFELSLHYADIVLIFVLLGETQSTELTHDSVSLFTLAIMVNCGLHLESSIQPAKIITRAN